MRKTFPAHPGVNKVFRARGIVALLYGTDAFRRLSPMDLHVFFDHVEAKECPAGTLLFMPEDRGERLYILRQGRVQLYRLTSNGRRVVTREIKPVSLFGIMGLLGQGTQGNFAEAVEDSLVCTVRREDVLELLNRRPDVAISLLELVGNRLRLLEDRLLEAVCTSAWLRVAHFLLANMDGRSRMVCGFTHEQIADSIGAVRQTVSIALGQMRRQGIVATRQGEILILQPHRLEEILRSAGAELT